MPHATPGTRRITKILLGLAIVFFLAWGFFSVASLMIAENVVP